MYGDPAHAGLRQEADGTAAIQAVAWLARAAGHGVRHEGPHGAGCVRLPDGEWIDLDRAAPALLARLADPAAKPAAVADLLELHAASAAAVTWKAADDDWPA